MKKIENMRYDLLGFSWSKEHYKDSLGATLIDMCASYCDDNLDNTVMFTMKLPNSYFFNKETCTEIAF